ncbi:MAG: GGDEF domain-containing protein [Lachnospiraceae bacterium]|nr:GGDEF domain-containing protein [Lachnospiraceae bacterium]
MAEIYSYLLVMFALIFGVSLAFRSHYVNKYKNRYFICAVLVNIGILIGEIGTYIGEHGNLRYIHIIANILTYSLAPLLPYCIVLMNRKCWKRNEKIAMIPAVVVILIALTTQYTGLLFYVDKANQYSRGPFFLISLAVCMLYFLMLTITSFREYRDADFSEKAYLFAILLLAVGGVFLQVILPQVLSMWTTTGISLLLYYTFVLESTNKYDVLTGVHNRRAFDSHKTNLCLGKDYELIVFDINGLKPVNDNMGHEKGDKLIMGVAGVLAKSFYGIGKIYRIGGDEFCVICEERNEAKINAALLEMEQNIRRANKNSKDQIVLSVSYGMEIHRADDERNYHEIFNAADEKMYRMKQAFYTKQGTFIKRETLM